MQRKVTAGRARIAIQIAVVETLAANGQDVRLAESILRDLIEVQKTIERYRQVIVEAMDRAQCRKDEPRLQEVVAQKGGMNDLRAVEAECR